MNEKLREALEAALVENPDDLAAHAAYADLLSEEGDPRGEFIQVQLALESDRLSPVEGRRLAHREHELWMDNCRVWFDDLAPLIGSDVRAYPIFRRGWLSFLEITEDLTLPLAELLAEAPQLRLLERLHILRDSVLSPLTHSPYLGNVRVLQLGDPSDYDDEAEYFPCNFQGTAAAGIVRLMPKLEELHLFTRAADTDDIFSLASLSHLRVLEVDRHRHYPLTRLGDNPALAGLTHLLCRPDVPSTDGAYAWADLAGLESIAWSPHMQNLTHLRLRYGYFGDEGVRAIIESGLLGHLEFLDLRHGVITDQGAEMLASRRELRRLHWLDVSGNSIGYTGFAALRDTRVSMRLTGMVDEEPDDEDEEGEDYRDEDWFEE